MSKQPEWAMRVVEEELGSLIFDDWKAGDPRFFLATENLAERIAKHLDPAVKELVDAAREAERCLWRFTNKVPRDRDKARKTLQSALKPFGGE